MYIEGGYKTTESIFNDHIQSTELIAMKKVPKIISISLALITITLISSCLGVVPFSASELKFVKPFTKTDTIVYTSEKGQIDTIIFSAVVYDTMKVRHIERGYYDENRIRVIYALTENSYHKLITGSVNWKGEDFLHFSKTKQSSSSKEIGFLGLLFSREYIESIDVNKQNEITFSETNATYKDVNINEGIKSFQFSFDEGVLSFIDNNNIRWTADYH